MKLPVGALAAVVVLSLGAWAAFYLLSPGAPLDASETAVVVGACAIVVAVARWVWARVFGTRDSGGPAS